MPFSFQETELPEVKLVSSKAFPDSRGFFTEMYKASEFNVNGIRDVFVQENHSHSIKGTIRGLHYQNEPMAQGKLVSVIHGEIYDVAVDIRKGSPRYGKWIGELLSAKNHNMLWIPIGFAHGFCVVSENADLVYKISGSEYAPEYESGIIWNDPEINIEWPVDTPVLSEKDLQLPSLTNSHNNFSFETIQR